jgi:hypothetical protein
MQAIMKKDPFKGSGKLSKLIEMILQGHEQGSGVSNPSQQISARYQTPLNKFLAGYGTAPLEKFLRDIRHL